MVLSALRTSASYFNLAGPKRQIQHQAQGAYVVEHPSEGGLEVRRLAQSLGQ